AYQSEPWKFGRHSGSKLITTHYEIYTTLTDPQQIEMIPDLVERAYEFYQQLVPPIHEPSERMTVYLLATRNQWATATAHLTGARAEIFLRVRNGGFSDGGVSVIQYVEPSVTGPLLAHEGFHQYLHCCVGPAVPAWLNEGLAVVCEGQRWTATRLREFDPYFNLTRQSRLADAVNRDRLFPLEELLRTHAGNVVQGTSTQVGTYYAQLWALMLFLKEGENGKYAAGFERLRRDLATPAAAQRLRAEQIWAEDGQITPGEALFRSYICDDLPTFEREYMAYLQSRISAAY
ncbi:MAG: hypothetical protein GX547_07705, partial [Phycisphaerae bacterium]|nr:hypothetical protein [Phycisphaerae bacterium]